MYQRYRTVGYLVLALLCVGFISQFIKNPGAMIIPVAVLGVVFYLYKFPPRSFGQNRKDIQPKSKRRTNLKVIQGNKRDDDNNEPPRYH